MPTKQQQIKIRKTQTSRETPPSDAPTVSRKIAKLWFHGDGS